MHTEVISAPAVTGMVALRLCYEGLKDIYSKFLKSVALLIVTTR